MISTQTETPEAGLLNLANAFFKKTFGSTAGYVVVVSKSSPSNLVVNIDSHLLSIESLNPKNFPSDVRLRIMATGYEISGKFDEIRQLINICRRANGK